MWYNWFTCKAAGMAADNINSVRQLSIQFSIQMPQTLLDISTSFIFSPYWASLPRCAPRRPGAVLALMSQQCLYLVSVSKPSQGTWEQACEQSTLCLWLTDLHTQRHTLWLSDLIHGCCWCCTTGSIFSHTWVNLRADSTVQPPSGLS